MRDQDKEVRVWTEYLGTVKCKVIITYDIVTENYAVTVYLSTVKKMATMVSCKTKDRALRLAEMVRQLLIIFHAMQTKGDSGTPEPFFLTLAEILKKEQE